MQATPTDLRHYLWLHTNNWNKRRNNLHCANLWVISPQISLFFSFLFSSYFLSSYFLFVGVIRKFVLLELSFANDRSKTSKNVQLAKSWTVWFSVKREIKSKTNFREYHVRSDNPHLRDQEWSSSVFRKRVHGRFSHVTINHSSWSIVTESFWLILKLNEIFVHKKYRLNQTKCLLED